MASRSGPTTGANRLHRKELQPTILAEQARLADRNSDRPRLLVGRLVGLLSLGTGLPNSTLVAPPRLRFLPPWLQILHSLVAQGARSPCGTLGSRGHLDERKEEGSAFAFNVARGFSRQPVFAFSGSPSFARVGVVAVLGNVAEQTEAPSTGIPKTRRSRAYWAVARGDRSLAQSPAGVILSRPRRTNDLSGPAALYFRGRRVGLLSIAPGALAEIPLRERH